MTHTPKYLCQLLWLSTLQGTEEANLPSQNAGAEVAVNIGVHSLFKILISVLLNKYPGVELLDHFAILFGNKPNIYQQIEKLWYTVEYYLPLKSIFYPMQPHG